MGQTHTGEQDVELIEERLQTRANRGEAQAGKEPPLFQLGSESS